MHAPHACPERERSRTDPEKPILGFPVRPGGEIASGVRTRHCDNNRHRHEECIEAVRAREHVMAVHESYALSKIIILLIERFETR